MTTPEATTSGAITGRLVVGVDGSESARRALAWAAEEASQRGARLQAVYAFASPTIAGVSPPAEYFAAIEAEARQLLDGELAAVAGVELVSEVLRTVVPEPAGAALVAASAGADLLVVGSRGLGGFRGLLLGSVSSQCVHHARCPVVVVRPSEDERH